MGSSGSTSDVTRGDVRSVFSRLEEPCTPLSTAEVANRLECAEGAAEQNLEALADRGAIRTRELDEQRQVWWQSADRTESAGQFALEEYGTFVNAVRDYAIFTLDPDGVVVSWNEGAARIKGYAEDEIVGEHFAVFYTEEDREAGVPEGNLETAAAEGYVEDEGWRVREDGAEFWADVTITAITDDDGELQGYTKVTCDMTEQREYEQRLRREQQFVEQVLETVPVSISVISSDGEFVRTNRQTLDRLGIEESALSEYTPDSWDVYDAEGEPIPVDERPWIEVHETGEPVVDYQCQVDLPELGRRWISVDAAPIEGTESDGRIVLSADDITERKEREGQLERRKTELETELAEILGRISDAFYAIDDEWCFTHLNERAAAIMQHSREELLGREVWEVFPEAREGIFREQFRTAMDTQEPVSFETYAEDQEAWLEFNAYPSESGLSIYFQDVTERKEREHELERYETLFTESTDVNAVLNPDGTFQYLPPSVENVLGYEPDELVGEVAFDYVHPEDRERVAGEFLQLVEDPEYRPINEFRYKHADGSWVWLESVGRNLLDDPSIEGIVSYTRDVTERRERERKLREREQRLERHETIVETVDDGVYVVDTEGHFTMVNEAYADMLDYSPEELVGAHVTTVVDEEVTEQARELETAESSDSASIPTIEAEVETADGERFPAEASFAMLPGDDDAWHRVGVVRNVSERKERERKLEESERRYRTLVESFPEGAVGLFDENLEYTAVGGQLMDEVGVSMDDRVGSSVYDVYPDDLVDEVEPYFEAALEGETNAFEAEFHDRHLYAHTLPVRDADDEIYAGMLVVQDVTERREAQRELRESEAKFRVLAENLDEIVWMATADADEFVYINPTFETVWGVDRDVLYDDPLAFLESVHEEDRERVRQAYGALPAEELDDEFRIVRPDGEVRWIHAQGARVADEEGEMDRIVGTGKDITERVERERELERALVLLERSERIADVGGWEIDVDTEDVFWSDHLFELLEVSGDEEPPLEEALDMYHEEDKPIVEDAVENALDAGDSFDVEARIRMEGDEVRWLRLQGVPETVDGDVVSFRGAAQDVTERKRREQRLEELVHRLEESNERLEQFAYAASHDLQEPLRMVSSYLQLIERRYGDDFDEDGQEFLDFAVDGADRMREMIDGLLQYSRVDTQGDPFEPVELDDVLADVRENLQMKIDESDAEITAEPLPTVEGDEGQLRQLFQNLLDNAIEYSGDEPPRIDVSADRGRGEWRISVRDEGIGIDPEDAHRVFEVFQSLQAGDERGGTGIGLALCERIVERHGGDIRVVSEPGEGATFTVTLPAAGGRD